MQDVSNLVEDSAKREFAFDFNGVKVGASTTASYKLGKRRYDKVSIQGIVLSVPGHGGLEPKAPSLPAGRRVGTGR